jgi:hypothetical protein
MQVSSMAATRKTTASGTPDMSTTFRSIADGSLMRSPAGQISQSYKIKKALTSKLFTHTDKKEFSLIYKEIQKGVDAKSYMTNGLLICD